MTTASAISTCAERCSRPRKGGAGTGGFTLIELLAVVLIVGLVVTVALLSVGLAGDDRALTQQARRIAALVELAGEEALLQGRDYGLEFQHRGWRFVEHDPELDRWVAVAGDDMLRPRELDDTLELALTLEDRQVALAEEAARIPAPGEERAGREADYLPHVLILSSGDVTPFELRIRRDSDRREARVAMTAAGRLELGPVDD